MIYILSHPLYTQKNEKHILGRMYALIDFCRNAGPTSGEDMMNQCPSLYVFIIEQANKDNENYASSLLWKTERMGELLIEINNIYKYIYAYYV
jgi:hypothetical protein